MRSQSAVPAILFALASNVVAKDAAPKDLVYTYSTATITECFSQTKGHKHSAPTHHAKPSVKKPAGIGKPVTVQVQAPNCHSCGCDTCEYVHSYTTAYDAFCPTGITKQVYVVAETYSGIASKPSILSTDLPCGFTREVQTCTTCGSEPITATITCPIEDVPHATGVWDSAAEGHKVEDNIAHYAAPAKAPSAHDDDKSKASVGPERHHAGNEHKGGAESTHPEGEAKGGPGSASSGSAPYEKGSKEPSGSVDSGTSPHGDELKGSSGSVGSNSSPVGSGSGSGSHPDAGPNSLPSTSPNSPAPSKVYTVSSATRAIQILSTMSLIVSCSFVFSYYFM